jgi:malonate-semialdehyde dehydrogenase (acetylating) / methylmalonate-semialdehyde dehydrogenase
MEVTAIRNYIDGEWIDSKSAEIIDVENPATGEVIARVPMSTREEVEQAVQAAKNAFGDWHETPPTSRIRHLFHLKELLEESFEDISRTLVQENGKTIDEARGEVRRGIENIEVAACIPSLMMGYNLEDIAQGIDEECVYQPLGVFCCVPPFNFPFMVPLWFMPFALACGNTWVVKPSEQVPLCQSRLFELMDEAGFPPGVVNLVNGAKEVVEALLQSPDLQGLSFVGSTPVAEHLYKMATGSGKRAQCQGGAKNYLVVMPDADLDRTVPALMTSCYGCAGERCLAGANIVAVGGVYEPLKRSMIEAASRIKVGDGLEEGVQMGPVISRKALERIHGYIEKGLQEGAKLVLDGRRVGMEDRLAGGHFIGPTIFDDVRPEMVIANEEIFGPVANIIRVQGLNEAISMIDDNPFGNAASIFTTGGRWAREFKYRVRCGNIGINIGIAAPHAAFPFCGMKKSFFGDLHGQGRDAIGFFAERKVVISRW